MDALGVYAADHAFEANIYTPEELVKAGGVAALRIVPAYEVIEEARGVVAETRHVKAKNMDCSKIPASLVRHFQNVDRVLHG